MMTVQQPYSPRCLRLLQVLVVVLVGRGCGQQPGYVADALGHALPEQQLGPKAQVLGVLDEAEANHGALAGAQLFLQPAEGPGQ